MALSPSDCPNRLREFRKRNGLTLQAVADKTGIAFTNLGKIETGDRDMKLWHIEKLSELYSEFPADFFREYQGGLRRHERALVESYRRLPPKMQEAVQELLKQCHEALTLGAS